MEIQECTWENACDWLTTYDWLVPFALLIRAMDSLLEYHDIQSCHLTCTVMRDIYVTAVWADIVVMQAALPGATIPLRVMSLMKDQADRNTCFQHMSLTTEQAEAIIAEDERRTANGVRWYDQWGSTNPLRKWVF